MRTSIWHIELTDGRIFKVFCENATQERKLILQVKELDEKVKSFSLLLNGINTQKQFTKMIKTL